MAPDKLTEIEMILKRHIREQNIHNQRMGAFATSQELVNTQISLDISTLRRGIYGDADNDVPGLLEKQKITDLEVSKISVTIKSVKTRQVRILAAASAVATGIVAMLNVVFLLVKSFFFDHK